MKLQWRAFAGRAGWGGGGWRGGPGAEYVVFVHVSCACTHLHTFFACKVVDGNLRWCWFYLYDYSSVRTVFSRDFYFVLVLFSMLDSVRHRVKCGCR